MELRPGYKQTEVGLIPEEWQALSIRELESKRLVSLFRGQVISKKDIARDPGDYPIYSSSVQNDGLFGRYGRYMFNEELITWSIDGGGNFFYRPQHRFSVTNVCGYMRVDSSALDCRFISYQLQRLHRCQSFDYTLKAHPSVIRGIYVVPLPPCPEQRAIAGALGDVDALLGALAQLIAKKRDLKHAAMQQLLTGQTRLPGFSGEWEVKRLGEIGSFSKGRGIRKDEVVTNGLPCIRYGEIYTHHNDYVRDFLSFIPAKVAKQSQQLRKGDLLFAGSGETAEDIGKCVAFLDDAEAYAGGDIVILSPTGHNSMYLGYLMNHPSIAEQKARMGQGDAVVHISARNLAQLNIRLPEEPEQTAIAAVLSDIDAELAALEQRLAKTHVLKQGMMQELLTGRTRLV